MPAALSPRPLNLNLSAQDVAYWSQGVPEQQSSNKKILVQNKHQTRDDFFYFHRELVIRLLKKIALINCYTLNKNSITSPSFTMYSFPSLLSQPLFRASERDPASSNC